MGARLAKPQRREAPMTLDLEALKRVAEAATPGPWEVSDADVRTSAFVRARGFGHVCNAPVPIRDWYERKANRESQARKNIAHIATFDPPTVLALIARLEAAEKALSWAQDDLESCAAAYGLHHLHWNGTHKAIINGTNAELRSWPETVDGLRECNEFIAAFNAENGPFPALTAALEPQA